MLFELPAMSTLAQHYSLHQFSPVETLLDSLLLTYREWNGNGVPNIAIVDWKDLPTSNEFILLRNHFEAHGVRTIICSPDELEYNRGRLRCGDFEIDLVYKRIIIHEFLARYDETHPLVRAYVNHDVCIVNPFRCKIMHKKASFELLTDESLRKLVHLQRARSYCAFRSLDPTDGGSANDVQRPQYRARRFCSPKSGATRAQAERRLWRTRGLLWTALGPARVGERNRHGAFVRLRRSGGHRFVPRRSSRYLTRPSGNFSRCLLIPIPFCFQGRCAARWCGCRILQLST